MVKKNFLMTAPLLMASFCSAQEKPNVVLIMVDDMGYSDIGCYGGEILTILQHFTFLPCPGQFNDRAISTSGRYRSDVRRPV